MVIDCGTSLPSSCQWWVSNDCNLSVVNASKIALIIIKANNAYKMRDFGGELPLLQVSNLKK